MARNRQAATLAAAPDVHHIDFDGHFPSIPLHRQRYSFSAPDALELLDQFGETPYRLVIDGDDDIAGFSGALVHAAQASALGGGARGGPHNDDALDAGARRRRFARGDDADSGRRHGTAANEFRDDAGDGIDWNGEAAPGARSRRRQDGGVDADDAPR